MPHGHRRHRGRHVARRPHRRVVLLALGIALGGGTTALYSSPLVRHHPPATSPDLAAANLAAGRTAAPSEVSRGEERTLPPSASPSAATSPSPSPSHRLVPVAGLTLAQTANAATIVDVARRRNLPRQAAVVAVATALQESDLHNLASDAVPESLRYPHEGDSVNLDSVGLFQQRPSQGWGTVAQLMDPRYASGAFYDRLVKVSGWQNLSVNDAAQAVQRSGFPDAYQKHESAARQIVTALLS